MNADESSESEGPYQIDPEKRRRATRFGLIIALVIFIMMSITITSRLLGW